VTRALADREEVKAGEARLTALVTPGHASDHLCFWLEDERALFSGDHIMSGSTVVIAPPDGHMDTYMASLRKVKGLDPALIYPGHGPVIEGAGVIDEYLAHRAMRMEQVDSSLGGGDRTVEQIVAAVYSDVAPALHPIARFSVQAHLQQLAEHGRACADRDPIDLGAIWSRVRRTSPG
jgi:glyoxylase-like metal-dependent hydrolase (beta-lactamase superfamily II)